MRYRSFWLLTLVLASSYAGRALAAPAYVSSLTYSPSTIYASPDRSLNFTSSFVLKEIGGAAITFTEVALAVHDAAGTFLFDVGKYPNVTVPANGTWTFPATAKYLAAPGTYKLIAKGRFNNGAWFDFGVTGAGVNPVTFTVQSGVSIHGRIYSQGAGNPSVAGATVSWAGYSTTTDANGNYSLSGMPCTTANLTVSTSGFYTTSFGYTPACNVVNTRDVAIAPWGYAGIASGVTVSPSLIYPSSGAGDNNFSVDFTLHETTGFPITFAEVGVAILDGNGNYLFDLSPPNLQNVTVTANGTWTYPTKSGYLVNPGTYKAVVRGHVAGGAWFDFGTTGGGVNPRTFTVTPRTASFGGRVTSQGAGAPGVDGATVSWGGYSTTTAGGGYYNFSGVPCQNAMLTVSRSGFYYHSESYTPTCLASSQKNVSIMPWGYARIATGVTVSPATIYASSGTGVNNFSVDFTLHETTGFPITFAEVGVAILDGDGNYLFDLSPPNLQNVTVPANGTWTYPTKSGYLVNPGTYQAVVRGHVAGGAWFDFGTTGGGVNPRTFTVLPRTASFGGRVTSQGAGSPGVDGATVTWGAYTTTTAGGGYYNFSGVPCQTATLGVSRSGYFDHSESYTPTCLSSSQKNVALMPWGYASIATGVTVSPAAIYPSTGPGDNNFSVDFTLRETAGFPITFAEVGVAILDGDGNYLFDVSPPNLQNVTVPANGTWTYPTKSGYLVNPGTYKAVVRGHVAGGAWFDFSTTGGGVNGRTFTVLPGTAAFGGRVTSQAGGNPGVDGATVTWGSYTTTTAGGGYYSFSGVPCQTATLRVTRTGYFDFAASYTPACQSSSQKNIALMPWGYASIATGVTVSPATIYASPGTGVNNFSVDFTLREVGGFPVTLAEVGVAILDGNGTFLFDLAPPNLQNVALSANGTWTYPTRSGYLTTPGTYRAVVRGRMAGGAWFDFSTTGGGVNSRSFTVLAGQTLAGSMSGTVTEPPPSNLPVSGASVTWGPYSTVTAANGTFAFIALPCESHPLVVTKGGYRTTTLADIALTCNQPRSVPVQLSLADVTIGGIVRDPTLGNIPVPFASVSLKTGQFGFTHSDGTFSFSGVKCKPNEITVSKLGHSLYRNALLPACGGVVNLAIDLPRINTSLRGTVVDATTQDPIFEADVWLGDRHTTTDVDGKYVLTNLGCEDLPLRISRPYYRTHSQTFTPRCNGGDKVDVNMEPIASITRERVIFVHGICGDGSMWDGMAERVANAGYDVRKVSYKPNNTHPGGKPVEKLREVVGQSPRPIHFVAHSMGGLVVREYLRQQLASGAMPNVKSVITMGTPHHGADVPFAARLAGMDNVSVAALIGTLTLIGDLPCHRMFADALPDMFPGSAFLNRLNYGSGWASPGVRYSWSLPRGGEILPPGVSFTSIAGTAGLYSTLAATINYQRPWGVWDDGIVSTTGAWLGAGPMLDQSLSPPQSLKHASGPMASGQALADNTALWDRVLLIMSGTVPLADAVQAGAPVVRAVEEAAEPVRLLADMAGVLEAGARLEVGVRLAPGADLSAIVDCDSCEFSLVDPDGHAYASVPMSRDTMPGTIGTGSVIHLANIDVPVGGVWRLVLDAAADGAWHSYRVGASQRGIPEPEVELAESRVDPGHWFSVTARDTAMNWSSGAVWRAEVQSDGEAVSLVRMRDDGVSPDLAASDGTFTGRITAPTQPGAYVVRVDGASADGGSTVVNRYLEVIRRGDLWVDVPTLAATRITTVGGDSVHVSFEVVNDSPYALDHVRAELWQEGYEVADSTAFAMAPWQRDTVVLHWRVEGGARATASVLVSATAIDDDASPENNKAGFIYADGVLGAGESSTGPVFDVQVMPNPGRGRAWLAIRNAPGRTVKVEVFDVAGRITWRREVASSSEAESRIDLFGSAGRVPAGVYLVRIASGGTSLKRRVVVLQ